MDFGAIIREARTSSGLSQADLANRAGVSIGAIYELEARGNGTVALLITLCQTLDLRFAGLPKGARFGEQVRALRLRRRWSQETLAGSARVSSPAIMRLESGNARIATLSAALKVLAPNARVRKPDIANWGSGSRDERLTPPDLFEQVVVVLGSIDLDPCAHPLSPVRARRYYRKEDDGLTRPWRGMNVYVNPPYSAAAAFVRKAHEAWSTGECRTIMMLLPVQTQHQFFHTNVVGSADVFFLRGKIAFYRPDLPRTVAPFGNMIVLFGADKTMTDRMLGNFDCVHLPRAAAVGRKTSSDAVQMRIAAE